jgi:hypothetical protein
MTEVFRALDLDETGFVSEMQLRMVMRDLLRANDRLFASGSGQHTHPLSTKGTCLLG